MPKTQSKSEKTSFESKLALITLAGATIPSVLLVATLWFFDVSGYLIGIAGCFLAFLSLYCVMTVWRRTQDQYRNLHNLLESIVHGDHSLRGAAAHESGELGELVGTINALAQATQQQRLQSEQSLLLVRKIIDQIDVSIIAWGKDGRMQFINPAAKKLLGLSSENSNNRLESKQLPSALQVANQFQAGETRVLDLDIAQVHGRFRLHVERFIADGHSNSLLFITDVSKLLKSEERKAWRNLIRVLSHEINNSLAPLVSLSKALSKQVQLREQDTELRKELVDGISIISNRAESMAEFVKNHQQIAQLPTVSKRKVELRQLAGRVVSLFPEIAIDIKGGEAEVVIDPLLMEQVLINLIKNAIESTERSSAESGSPPFPIVVDWEVREKRLIITVLDSGEGIQSLDNLFVPFYTTKPHGSGIGLVISQQIIEAHGGDINICNRTEQRGCRVTIDIPAIESTSSQLRDRSSN
ncbi:MAG: ATP-binding protein [Gammaproteobacteria bacterium]|nr:ATP-binding protein [Gammaproteobacteria bacterium]MDP2140577.1 ATP-binding protein [Gammaproteobacteria bacterium]MDP2347346.1 ATP-binding protein [Gammaproteobacteria bacterium]